MFIVAWQPLYDAAYHELVLPDDLATPLGLRVLGDVPWVVAAVLVAWVAGRRRRGPRACGASSIGRRPILVAWLLGWIDIVRRPVRVIATAAFGIVVLTLLTVPSMAAAAAGWARVRDVMTHPDDAVGVLDDGRDLGRGLARRPGPRGRRRRDPGRRLDARVDARPGAG